MPVSLTQKTAIEEVIQVIVTATPPGSRNKRRLAEMFMELVDRKDWAQYYEIIPEPRCLNHIRSGLEKNRYKDTLDVYTDLSLVFWNALFYNEPDSQIAGDATTLKSLLETEWKKRSVLPLPRSFSPPPSSAQKVHGMVVDASTSKESSVPPAPASASALAPTPVAAKFTPQVHRPSPATAATAQPAAAAASSTPAPPPPPEPEPEPERSASPEIEVDVGGTPSEAEVQGGDSEAGPDAARNPVNDEIVRQLEKSVPKWSGFSDLGWMRDVLPDRYSEIVQAIKSYKDVIGNRLATALESIPDDAAIPNLSYTTPLSLKLIESRARHKSYNSSKEFDMDMARLFEKARRWHEPCSEPYGRALLLQRLYQALTSSKPPPGPPYSSTNNFAYMAAGPGSTKNGQLAGSVPNLSSLRLLSRDRVFVEEVQYKGWTVKCGDWVHLSNPDDPARPIPGQVFKCWTWDEPSRRGEPGISVAWYFRPEQTFHPANRTFFENEVFKSSHFGDHPLEDIIEKIAVQFTARHIRGRPRPPYWYPGWPLYVCDSRYHDQERTFVRIKNWNSCIPESLRKNAEYMPIYEFERTVYPRRLASPFVAKGGKLGVKGPGGIVDGNSTVEVDASTTGRKRTRRGGGGQDTPTPQQGASPAPPAFADATNALVPASGVPGFPYQTSHMSHPLLPIIQRPDRSITSAAGSLVGHQVQSEELPAELARHFDRDPETNEVLWFAAPPLDVAMPPMPRHSMAYLHFLAMKRKKGGADGVPMDVDGDGDDGPIANKRSRTVLPTVTETMREVAKEVITS